jgi:hypothetical protein
MTDELEIIGVLALGFLLFFAIAGFTLKKAEI